MITTIDEAAEDLEASKRWKCKPSNKCIDMAIKVLRQQNKIAQIIDDCDLEAWEVLEKIKEVVKE
jgi:hypothetical protein